MSVTFIRKEKEKQVPPYVPYKTLKSFLRSLTQGVPPKMDKGMLRSMSGSTQSQLVQTLKALHLMNDQWVPAEGLNRLVATVNTETEYRVALRAVLLDAYPFLSHFDPRVATLKMLEDELEKMGASGGTIAKCISFFIPAVKDAGYEVSSYIEKPGRRPSVNGRPKRAQRAASKPLETPPITPLVRPQGSTMTWHAMLLAKFPDLDPEWSDEVKAKWFDSFAKLHAAGEVKPK